MLKLLIKIVLHAVVASAINSASTSVGPPAVDICAAVSLGCYYKATETGQCSGGFASWRVEERSYEEGPSQTYLPAGLDNEGKYCFRPFTEDEIFKGGRTADDYCWSQAARCFMYVENKVMCLYALNRCSSVPGLTTQHVMDEEGKVIDQVSYDKFIRYYKEMCARVSDLNASFEQEISNEKDDEKKKKMEEHRAKNSPVVWAKEACEPYENNKLSDAAFKPVTIAPQGSDPKGNS